MLCKKCSTALRIKNSYYAIAGGDSPDTETRLLSVTELACPNKRCEKFDKPIRLRRAVGFIEEGVPAFVSSPSHLEKNYKT